MVEDPMRRLTNPKDAYRQVNARSQGGAVDYGYSGYPSHGMQLTLPGSQGDPKVTPSGSVRPRTAAEADVLQNPIQTQWQNRGNITSAKNYRGRSANDYAWADRVNSMGPEQLNALLAPGAQAFRSRQSPVNAAKTWGNMTGKVSVEPGSMYPVTPNGRITSDGLNKAFTAPMSQGFAQNVVQALANTPQQRQGFSMDPIAPRNLPTQRPEVPAWSLNGGVSPETENAFRGFQSTPVPASPNIGRIIEERIMENLANAGAQGRQAMNDRVDGNLAASDRLGRTMGGADYRAAGRTGVIPPRGMGALPSDAGVMARLTQPLGDGGPAAYAARADQARRRQQAEEVMGGVGADGLTRYMPNNDLLNFANQDRAREDQRISALVGGGTQARPALEAMTPSEIQFYRHRMNMLTNPAYAERVNTERADRREMLDNRRNMVRARREGALEAAGASQQMRNLMAGRGAVGPGADGMAALTSLAARGNPAVALNQNNQMAMMERRAQLERDAMDRATRVAIYSSGMSGPEMDLALQRLDAANNGTPVTSPLQTAGAFVADPNASPRDRYLAAQKYFSDAAKTGAQFTEEQKRQIMMSQGINPSAADIMEWQRDASTFMNPYDETGGAAGMVPGGESAMYFLNPLLRWLGVDSVTRERQRQLQDRLNP